MCSKAGELPLVGKAQKQTLEQVLLDMERMIAQIVVGAEPGSWVRRE